MSWRVKPFVCQVAVAAVCGAEVLEESLTEAQAVAADEDVEVHRLGVFKYTSA